MIFQIFFPHFRVIKIIRYSTHSLIHAIKYQTPQIFVLIYSWYFRHIQGLVLFQYIYALIVDKLSMLFHYLKKRRLLRLVLKPNGLKLDGITDTDSKYLEFKHDCPAIVYEHKNRGLPPIVRFWLSNGLIFRPFFRVIEHAQ